MQEKLFPIFREEATSALAEFSFRSFILVERTGIWSAGFCEGRKTGEPLEPRGKLSE